MTGGACSDVVPFFGYVWVDDPVLVKPDTPPRLHCAEEAIRLAMLAVLCPRAINEEKLSEGLSPWLTGELAQDSEQLIKFAMWCWWPRPGSRGNSASTVVSKLSHISCDCQHLRHENDQLRSIFSVPSAPAVTSNQPTIAFSGAGAAVMGYFNMLRRSEYLSDRGNIKPYAIHRRDITFRAKDGIQMSSKAQAHAISIHFRGSKMDQ
ncbi:hypothetical protein PC129_g19632 [Phytophthora cactorum]|uniref:Uncharacterized protein n=1 Tax=Phytophthora cactorum TaxID=29920 RepID=A0A8T1AQC5_9STRA|nr:hypothetical protein Pcac1_g2120 [Phytophthora cactorum]KAG2879133.1 hypothetical protein PC114_g22731 [Phytophthora cactorum]KAG2887737.1 hypothetical protein PC115_g20252 [Phytophthora cactorum]KAG2898535.1 hypothetical protein PC117_g22498 [Phytophthora cactorum]KAG3052787.1 hypothetical protein PC121_g17141 [Phytophthora cactorum]